MSENCSGSLLRVRRCGQRIGQVGACPVEGPVRHFLQVSRPGIRVIQDGLAVRERLNVAGRDDTPNSEFILALRRQSIYNK